MKPTLPPLHEAIEDDEIAYLRTGTSKVKMLCRVMETSKSIVNTSWSQPIPDEMTRMEAEYYALNKGLQTVRQMGYAKAIVQTHYEPITDLLRNGCTPTEELRPFHEKTVKLVGQFDEVDINPKPWDR